MKKYIQHLNSWTYSLNAKCIVYYPENLTHLKEILHKLKKEKQKVIVMGHGCSHGDLFINKNGSVINTKNLDKIKNFDKKNNCLTVEPGVNVAQVNQFLYNKNFILNSIPSSFQITIGGAIANNVFGKDSHKNGYFEKNIKKIIYIDSNLKIRSISRKNNKLFFEKFVGSLGLLGIIIEVELNVSELKSPYIYSKAYYLENFDEFIKFQKNINFDKVPFCTFKINQFSKNKKIGRIIANLSSWDKKVPTNKLPIIKDINLYKKINLLKYNFYLSRNKYLFIKKNIFLLFSILSSKSQFFWKTLNFLGFEYFRFFNVGKLKKTHILDYLHNNNFTDHNILFRLSGAHSMQVLIPIKKYQGIVTNILELIQKYNCESYLSSIKFLPKRSDFIYKIGKHVALELYFLKKKNNSNQDLFISKIFDLIIKNKCQLVLSKDNLLNKNLCNKIFPKTKEFAKLKKIKDKNDFFSSSYYKRVLK